MGSIHLSIRKMTFYMTNYVSKEMGARKKNVQEKCWCSGKKIGNQRASFFLLDTFYLNIIYYTKFSKHKFASPNKHTLHKKWFSNDTETDF